MTRFFDGQIAGAFPQPMDALDAEMKEHLVFVFNQVLQAVRKGGWTAGTLERSGRLLRRLWIVFRQYRAKRARATPAEWIGRAAALGQEAKSIFG